MGLVVYVYRNPRMDCTLGGLTSEFSELTLVNADGPFYPAPGRPAVMLDQHVPGCLRIVPAELVNGRWVPVPNVHYSMGGNFAHTSDSRFAEACRSMLEYPSFYGAVAIHDRRE